MGSMRLQTISLTNFGPFTAEQTITLDGTPGLVWITGSNQVAPELGANGVGKTTLFDAITFAWCGRTSDGARGPDLRNWQAEEQAIVDHRFTLGRHPYRIRRTIGPNSIWLTEGSAAPVEVEQSRIDELRGMSQTAFLASVHHGQGLPSFLDFGPTAQLDLISELLNLDVYSDAAGHASDTVKSLNEQINELKIDIGRRRGRLTEVEDQIARLENQDHNYARERMRFLLDFDQQIQGWQKQLNVDLRHRDQTAAEYRDLPRDQIKSLAAKAKAILQDLTSERAEATRMRTRRANLHEALRTARACPTCGRAFVNAKMAEEHAKGELADLDKQLVKADKLIEQLRDEHAAADRDCLDLSRQVAEREKQLQAHLRDKDARIARCETELKNIKQRRDEVLNEESPYARDLELQNEKLAELTSTINRMDMRLAGLTRRETHYSYWIRAFKDLRLTVAEHALLQLTVETNSLLHHFGLEDWRLTATGEGLTKAGHIKRGLSLAVDIDGHPRPTGRVSGGERQRLRLAVALGISNLVRHVTGTHCNVELFDEPTTWLSGRGVELLLSALADRAQQQAKRVFLADHRGHAYPFVGQLRVTKSSEGSTVQPV